MNSKQRRAISRMLKRVGTALPPVNKVVKKDGSASASQRERFNDLLGLASLAFTVAAWGWTALAPDSSIWFGSGLLLLSVAIAFLAVQRVWRPKRLFAACLVLVGLLIFSVFDYFIVIKPQRGKPFKDLLVQGYHISSQCGSLPAHAPMPTWMRDQSKAWQAQVEQAVSEKLDYKYSQAWQSAIIIGLVTDENTVSYQCTWLANKVGALETIISKAYDPTLKHRDYEGPVYWFQAGPDGKVDISNLTRQPAESTKK
jgi:hypothetical protein